MPNDSMSIQSGLGALYNDMAAGAHSGNASDSMTYAQRTIVGTTGQQRWGEGGVSPVKLGTAMHMPQYSPLSQIAFGPFDANNRNWTNLFHPQPPTADKTPRPDWNAFDTLNNWPMRAASGLRTTIFGGPQQASPKGKA